MIVKVADLDQIITAFQFVPVDSKHPVYTFFLLIENMGNLSLNIESTLIT